MSGRVSLSLQLSGKALRLRHVQKAGSMYGRIASANVNTYPGTLQTLKSRHLMPRFFSKTSGFMFDPYEKYHTRSSLSSSNIVCSVSILVVVFMDDDTVSSQWSPLEILSPFMKTGMLTEAVDVVMSPIRWLGGQSLLGVCGRKNNKIPIKLRELWISKRKWKCRRTSWRGNKNIVTTVNSRVCKDQSASAMFFPRLVRKQLVLLRLGSVF